MGRPGSVLEKILIWPILVGVAAVGIELYLRSTGSGGIIDYIDYLKSQRQTTQETRNVELKQEEPRYTLTLDAFSNQDSRN